MDPEALREIAAHGGSSALAVALGVAYIRHIVVGFAKKIEALTKDAQEAAKERAALDKRITISEIRLGTAGQVSRSIYGDKTPVEPEPVGPVVGE